MGGESEEGSEEMESEREVAGGGDETDEESREGNGRKKRESAKGTNEERREHRYENDCESLARKKKRSKETIGNSPDDTKSNLNERVDQRLKLALDSSSLDPRLPAARRRENQGPEVDAVGELPVVNSLVRVLNETTIARERSEVSSSSTRLDRLE